jgi:hypothetical protein
MEVDPRTTVLPTNGCYSPDLASLCAAAVQEITEHLNYRGLCVICGSAWPCERAVLAEHNLALF